jgi:hypothetical protein
VKTPVDETITAKNRQKRRANLPIRYTSRIGRSVKMLGQRARALRRMQSRPSATPISYLVSKMKIDSIRDVIATRQLHLGADSVHVSLGLPIPFPDNLDFYCPYAISYRGVTRYGYAGGVDAIQALQLTMVRVGIDLQHLAKSSGLQISWLLDTPGDTGFPH